MDKSANPPAKRIKPTNLRSLILTLNLYMLHA